MQKASLTRTYAVVAGQVAERIASGEFAIGDRLPSERELAQEFGISRPTMREAIIALEVDGLIEVKQGSGMYVLSAGPRNGRSAFVGVGPFELLEARRAVESEACALAASRGSEQEIDEIAGLLESMRKVERDFIAAEKIDRDFHVQIARASQNSALLQSVEALWEARLMSPQQHLLSAKAHLAGIGPRIDEHLAILEALKSRDQKLARNAMRVHLNRVLESLIVATEVQETEILAQKNQVRRRMLSVED